MTGSLVIYGASGFTGGLTARKAVEAGLEPVLAGRRPEALAPLADELGGLPTKAFALDDPQAMDAALADAAVLVNCAGPFPATVAALADTCVRTGTHYLDLAGEVEQYEIVRERAEQAEQAGVMLMPGVGFGIVPTDCVAVHLKRRLPSATRLELAFQTVGEISRGTAGAVLTGLHRKGVERRGGSYVPIRPGARRREIDFGDGPVKTVTNPWRGDICTAYHSTGIGDIEAYIAPPGPLGAVMASTRYTGWFLGSPVGQGLLRLAINRLPYGPTEEQLAAGYTRVWERVQDPDGNTATTRLRGPEAYVFTALTAVDCARRALGGDAAPGFQTPAQLYGPELVTAVEGVVFEDLSS
jgi:short subunit dehydrogenase-like uncharacterized protein